MGGDLVSQLRGLLHPIVVHFPIALLFASVGLDWVGYLFRLPNLTRAGFYVLALGALGAGVAALTGPDHAAGDATVVSLLTLHQSFALITVALAVALLLVRYMAADGLGRGWALLYLGATVALLAVVALTGYYGGELTYHQGIGVSTASGPVVASSTGDASVHLPVKPMVALIGLVAVAVLGGWPLAGRNVAAAYYARWIATFRAHLGTTKGDTSGRLWTLWR
jgi:uncharacterized membrane protein